MNTNSTGKKVGFLKEQFSSHGNPSSAKFTQTVHLISLKKHQFYTPNDAITSPPLVVSTNKRRTKILRTTKLGWKRGSVVYVGVEVIMVVALDYINMVCIVEGRGLAENSIYNVTKLTNQPRSGRTRHVGSGWFFFHRFTRNRWEHSNEIWDNMLIF